MFGCVWDILISFSYLMLVCVWIHPDTTYIHAKQLFTIGGIRVQSFIPLALLVLFFAAPALASVLYYISWWITQLWLISAVCYCICALVPFFSLFTGFSILWTGDTEN